MLEIKNTVYFRFFDITVAILNRNIHAGQINTNVFNVWGDNLFNVISTVAWKIQIKVRFVFFGHAMKPRNRGCISNEWNKTSFILKEKYNILVGYKPKNIITMSNDEHSNSGQNETFSGDKPNDIFNKEIKVDISFFSN